MAVEQLQHVGDVRYQAMPRNGLAGGLRVAGFALAHAAFSIETDGRLWTLAAVAEEGELHRLYRYPSTDLDASVRTARDHLARDLGDDAQGALVYTGSIHVGRRRRDALIVDIFGPHGTELGRIAQPYRRRRFRLPRIGYLRRFAIQGHPIVEHLAEEPGSRHRDGGPEQVESRIYWGVHDHPHGVRLFRRPMRSHARSR
ncbi:MAG TPA: hypothetical protein VH720_02510 [Candidatus Limnocylindrales bacterium]|jgi:hypothetical protein